jgi:uncharacterized protein involved in exopolysaccharide biosynthesis
MKDPVMVKFRTDSVNIVNVIIRYWKVLLISAIAAAIISSVISLTITPLFRSVVVLYPTTNVVESQITLGMQSGTTPLFGDETGTEKVLQILKSDDIKDFLVAKYDLMKHYNISANSKYKYSLLDLRMKRYIVSRKTQFNSVEIAVLDSDPETAAAMSNDIARQIDTVFNKIVKNAGRKSYLAVKSSYNEQMIRVKALEDSVKMISSKGSVSIIPEKFKAGSANSSWVAASGQYTPELLRLMNMFETENENLSAIRTRLTESEMIAEQNLPYTHVINAGQVSEKKAMPRRTLIVIASTLSALLMMTFILALSEMIVKDEKQS